MPKNLDKPGKMVKMEAFELYVSNFDGITAANANTIGRYLGKAFGYELVSPKNQAALIYGIVQGLPVE